MKNHIVSSRIKDKPNECLEEFAKKNDWTVSFALSKVIDLFFGIKVDNEAA